MDKNKHILEEAIRKLPQYQPPASLWENITEGLEEDRQDVQWRSKIEELPQYEAPAFIWDNIAEELPAEAAIPQKGKLIRLMPRIAAAASVLLLLTLGVWWQTRDTAKIDLVITQEIAPQNQWTEDWDQDDADIESVMQLAANSPMERPEDFERLKADLEELNSARAELLELMEAYGKDPKVMQEIGEIERQRSAVVKQVVSLI
ncbi:MAG: hypothetical protein HRU41_16805 [Saprospiraceae bacterium]|nr:hypothetical protein [Saprospiraceae bacterium]